MLLLTFVKSTNIVDSTIDKNSDIEDSNTEKLVQSIYLQFRVHRV